MLKDAEVGKKVLPPGEPVSNKASNTFNIHINIYLKERRSQRKQQRNNNNGPSMLTPSPTASANKTDGGQRCRRITSGHLSLHGNSLLNK